MRTDQTRRSPRLAAGAALALVLSAATVLDTVPAAGAALQCYGQAVTLKGTAGSDRLQGTAAVDVIWGGRGHDVIDGAGGEDVMCGGGGNDQITGGSATDVLLGQGGNDRLVTKTGTGDHAMGGPGADRLLSTASGAALFGEDGDDALIGTGADQLFYGEDGDDYLSNTGSNASLDGGKGHDRISGSLQTDKVVDGGPGNDEIATADGDDGSIEHPVLGGPGRDLIEAGAGTDIVDGGSGNDTIDLGTGTAGWAAGQEGDDTMFTAESFSSMVGGTGDDGLSADAEGVTLYGDADADTLVGSDHPEELLSGGDGDDEVNARGGDDEDVTGDSGSDTIRGGSGSDSLDGGSGGDTLYSGEGATDSLLGGLGNDTLHLESDGSSGEGGEHDDVLTSTAAGTHLFGDAGLDTLNGGPGADLLYGGGHDDVIRGKDGGDTAQGNDGNDVLEMGAGADTCLGGAGTDTCDGGTPGPAENTPDDVDTCDETVETKVSCREGGLPAYFTGVAEGSHVEDGGPDSLEDAQWRLEFRMVPDEDASPGFYDVESMEVSYTYQGFYYRCTWDESGARPAGSPAGYLQLRPGKRLYSFSVAEYQGLIQYTEHCPDGDRAAQTVLEMAGATFDQPWNPDAPVIVGQADVPTGDQDVVRQWSWRLEAAPGSP